MSAWTLAGFAAMVMVPLVMIFPKQDLVRQATQQKLGDALAVSYLNNLLKADPGNLELRVFLAEHRLFLREYDGLQELLAPALHSTSAVWRAQGMLVEYKLLTGQFLQSAPGSAQRAELRRRRSDALLQLHRLPWPLPTLIYLAGQADQLGERGVSLLLYQRITDASAQMSAEELSVMAYQMLGEGDYELSAHLYFIARHKADTLARRREYFLAGIRALISGNLLLQAMQGIDRHLGALERDAETLYELIKTARAANDQPRAVRYAKQLLHLAGQVGPVVARWQQMDLSWLGISNAEAADEMPQAAPSKMRPYVKKEYELAYQVFVENRKLEDAYRVAEAAVRQSPGEADWHRRLAQIAEWTDRPKIALREWRWLLRDHETMEALSGVLRLAPSLNEYEAVLDAWKRIADRQALDAAQWENMAGLFERTGRQREGIAYFERRYARERVQMQLELAARLAERSGEDALAIALYVRLLQAHGSNTAWHKQLANLYLRQGQYRTAYDLLQANRDRVKEDDITYWKFLAELAWHLQQDADAKKNFQRLAQTGSLAREDFSRLIYLLEDTQAEEKATLAELAYRRYGERDMLLLALEINADTGNMPAQKRLFERAALDRQLDVSGNARFYQLRAQYRLTQGEFEAARKDYHRVFDIASYESGRVESDLWFLINSHDLPGLRAMLAQVIARGDQNTPALWGVLAASYQALDQPSRAVAYYSRQFKQGKQDFLWLMNYADALEQARQAGMAARVRRHAWLLVRDRFAGSLPVPPYSRALLGAAQMALQNAPGDPALALIREVLRQDRLLERGELVRRKVNGMSMAWPLSLNTDKVEVDRRVNELVLGWAVSQEHSANAKAWLWQRYAQALDRPQWAQASVAIADQDTASLTALLDGARGGLSMLTHHDAANTLGRSAEAQTLIHQGLADNPENNEIHQRLTEDTLATASALDIGWRTEKIGGLHRLIREVRVDMPLARAWRVGAEYRKASQRNNELPAFGVSPPTERVAGLLLKHRGATGDTEFALRRRNEFAGATEAHLTHALKFAPRLNVLLGAEFNAAATESTELQLFGMRNQLAARVHYTFSKREYLQVESAWARYRTQNGAALGNGQHLAWEFGYRVRTEYPDWGVRVNGTHTRFGQSAIAAFALPADTDLYGVCTGFGDSVRNTYTWAWRPYLDYCTTWNSVSGQGYTSMFGVAGALIGEDQLALTLRQERGGANLINGLSHEFAVTYRRYFD
ncbi:tetratricopeptide repeat protein [Ferrigenium sp. UT5]|uniref:tetratricopeptide repeat protein n=1 Tax=Ferrigenium sp. UT5 TaxID=3242105 RepID=UPI0038B2949E